MREWRPSEPDPRVSIFRFPRRTAGGTSLGEYPLIAFDVETTGLNGRTDRIVELAVVRMDRSGRIVDEWASLVDPGCDVGPTFVHHITNEAVAGGPMFGDLLGDLMPRLEGGIVVSHNAPFEESFLRHELRRVGVAIDAVPAFCTLDIALDEAPYLPNHRLSTCFEQLCNEGTDTGGALGDARLKAQLAFHLRELVGPDLCWDVGPPALPRFPSGRGPLTRVTSLRKGEQGWMAGIIAKLPLSTGADGPRDLDAYFDVLSRALSDGKLTGDEAKQLARMAGRAGLGAAELDAANGRFLDSLKAAALADHVLTAEEVADLERTAGLLGRPGYFGSLAPTAAAAGPAIASVAVPRPSSPTPLGHGPVTIGIDALPVLSYAAAHNRVPVVRTVTLTSGLDADGARLVITIRDDEGEIAERYEQAVDLAVGRVTEVTAPAVRLDPSTLLQIKERRPAWITAQVIDEDVLTEAEVEVSVLAGAQWLAAPPGVAFELLAAYVMPNDPVIGPVLVDAAERLGRSTGRTALDGYQAGSPDRVDAIVHAIWDAVQARAIRYAMPPASWADIGQKVRTPADVLDGRLGTCLDTTLVFAAALEQAGIRPLLVVTAQHAFLAYWRIEATLDAIAYFGGHDIVNDVDLGRIGVVETTLATEQLEPTSFGDAVREAMAQVRRPDDVQAVVDVWQARQAGVVPLPVRRALPDGSVQIIGYQAAEVGDRRLVIEHHGARADARAVAREVPPRVQQWKNSLLDLSLRNRLINYTDRAGVAIRVPEGMLGQVEDLISARRPLALRPDDQIEEVDRARGVRLARDLPDDRARAQLVDKQAVYTDVLSAGYQTRMRGLANKARTIQEETGANNLYLALGSLDWELDGRRLRSPLVLVPVRLTTTSQRTLYRVELDESGGSTPNYCLLEKLKQVHGIEVPGLAEPEQDDLGIDLDAAFQATRVAIAAKALPFHVEERADLSILQFAKFRLWKDLDEHWEDLAANPLVRHLIETPTDPFVDPVPAPEQTDLDALDGVCPMPADASQLEAVAEAAARRTFVLEGPPGTGKSQTITNLLTRAVATGMRVLFVAEKRAALDVVSSRLESVGMGEFSLDLHDKAARPNVVRSQIALALDHTVAVDREGFESNEEDLRSSRRTLARYAERLHEENPAGFSYYTARTRLLTLGVDGVAMEVPRPMLGDRAGLDQVRTALRDLPDVASIAAPSRDHPWGFVGLTALEPPTDRSVRAAVRAVDDAVADAERLPEAVQDVVRSARTVDDLQVLGRLAAYPVPLATLDVARSDDWRQRKEALVAAVNAFAAGSHPAMTTLSPEALQLPIAEIHAEARAAENAGFLGKRKERKAVAARLAAVARPGFEIDPGKVAELAAQLLQLRSTVDALAQQCTTVAGIGVPPGWNPLTPEGAGVIEQQAQWIEWAASTVDPAAPTVFTGALRSWLQAAPAADPNVARALDVLARAFEQLAGIAQAQPATWARWCGTGGLVQQWLATAGRRHADDANELVLLRRWAALAALLEILVRNGLGVAAELVAIGELDAEDAARAFERGVALASIDERADAMGLYGFDPPTHESAVRRFTRSLSTARAMMTSVVPQQVLSSRSFDAASGMGRVGELRRELAKQRRGLGVRALMERYGDLITQLMPTVLVSPDSVARFFPVGSQTFDLVVFDEASQIRVADSIGAMGRARSVVVVGDSKQMPPTSTPSSASKRAMPSRTSSASSTRIARTPPSLALGNGGGRYRPRPRRRLRRGLSTGAKVGTELTSWLSTPVSAPSACDGKPSFASGIPSPSSSGSHALPCPSPSRSPWSVLGTVTQLSVPSPSPSPSASGPSP